MVPITSKVKLYAKLPRRVALGLEFKCSIASSVHTEPHLPFSFHPTLLNVYLLWKSFYLFGFLYQRASLLILCFRTIRFISLYVLNKNHILWKSSKLYKGCINLSQTLLLVRCYVVYQFIKLNLKA